VSRRVDCKSTEGNIYEMARKGGRASWRGGVSGDAKGREKTGGFRGEVTTNKENNRKVQKEKKVPSDSAA